MKGDAAQVFDVQRSRRARRRSSAAKALDATTSVCDMGEAFVPERTKTKDYSVEGQIRLKSIGLPLGSSPQFRHNDP